MKRTAFTLLEAIVVVAVLLILAAILFPVLATRRHTKNTSGRYCQSNLKQIALGFKQYIQDYHEKYPVAKNSNSGLEKSDSWAGVLSPYLKSTQIFQCAADKNATDNKKSSYAYNSLLSRINEKAINNPATIILNFEVAADPDNSTQTGTSPATAPAITRHFDGSHFSFVDGHVKWYKAGVGWLKPGKVTAAKPDGGTPTFVPG